MIFLKRFQATGFKSFAEPIDLSFNAPMTGVVGPNGAGKSNIVDAIKWVMGEQSLKTLRGKSSEDVIFHGSNSRAEAPFAEVRLTFSNEGKIIAGMGETFTIARRVSRQESGSEYYIDNQPARLRDVHALFLDTGLSKGSLGIISQGTVQWFAEAKPEDRRRIFEEAASVGRYTKNKNEALAKLEGANNNVNRVNDLVIELGKDLKRLQKQAERAKLYAEMTKRLAAIEVNLLVNDVDFYSAKLSEFKQQHDELTAQLADNEGAKTDQERQLAVYREQEAKADADVADLSARLNETATRLNQLQTQRTLQAQRLDIDLSSLDAGKRAQALLQKISSLTVELEDRQRRTVTNGAELEVYRKNKTDLENKQAFITQKISQLDSEMASLRTRRQILEERMASSAHLFEGVRTVLAHKESLIGINDIFINLIRFDDKYARAITTALGNAQQNIVVDTDQGAVDAIGFLKSNRAGTATFLPLDTIKPRTISPDFMTVLKQLPGFVGTGASLVSAERKYEPAVQALLGALVVATDNNAAINLARHTYQTLRVVSLEGDIIQPGGAITGGYKRNDSSVAAIKADLEMISKRFVEAEGAAASLAEQNIQLSVQLENAVALYTERQIARARLEEFIKTAGDELETLKAQYGKVSGKTVTSSDLSPDQVVEQQNVLQSRHDKLAADLRVARDAKLLYASRVKELIEKFMEQNTAFAGAQQKLTAASEGLVKSQAMIENATSRLADGYKLTYEAAKERAAKSPLDFTPADARSIVNKLRRDIEQMGPINAEAVTEYESKEAHHAELTKQLADLQHARDAILASIQEMDAQAIAALKQVVDGINAQLPEIFKYLFSGGSCTIEYADPDNILESGIEVLARPPGKTVNSLNLLSGGEKTLVALAVLFAILRVKRFPMVILDEAESALDPANVERFGEIVHANAKHTQFIVITHRPGTMERCDALFGATMQQPGITKMVTVSLSQAEGYASPAT